MSRFEGEVVQHMTEGQCKSMIAKALEEHEEERKLRTRERISATLGEYYVGSPYKLDQNTADFLLRLFLEEVDWYER